MGISFADYLARYLSSEAVAQIVELAEPIQIEPDRPFVIQGEVTTSLFYVPESVVRYYVDTEEGSSSNKHFTLAPCVVGSTTALLREKPSRLSIAATTRCLGQKLSWQAFRQLSLSSNEILTFYTQSLERLFVQKEERETSFLVDSATERYQRLLGEFPGIEEMLPQYHIASYLGVTPVSLSRIRGGLRGQGKC